ncbi:MAG: acetyl-CoA carboxylase carboxyltransferase subunit alpha [Chloroflexota bacterium]
MHPTDVWERVALARHPQRPYARDYARLCSTDFVELRGDRLFADDAAIIGGPARLDGETVMLIGHQKGRSTRENVVRRFGMARPEGFRKALRLMRYAERFRLPVITFVDIPGADPSLEAEERGQALAIAGNLEAMALLRTPIVAVVTGEGGSGGALALGMGDRVLMLENAIYSVASPEAAASILWRDAAKAREAAAALQLTAEDALRFGVVDAIVPEPPGGAHTDHRATAEAVRHAVRAHLDSVRRLYGGLAGPDVESLLEARYQRYHRLGLEARWEARSASSIT